MIRPLAVALAAAAIAAPVHAQTDTIYYVTRLGTDTLAVERLIRSPNRAVVEGVSRVPQTRLRTVVIDFDERGGFVGMQSLVRDPEAPPEAPPIQGVIAALAGDSIEWRVVGAQGSRTLRSASATGMLPGLNPFVSQFQLLTDIALRANADSVALGVLGMQRNTPYTFRRVGQGHYLVAGVPAGTAHIWLDERGRIRRYQASDSEYGVVSELATATDLDALVRRFAALDAAGRGMGQLSPRDTARASFGGGELSVDYSRPGKRGRRIFGGVVPWGEVWRTGANEATTFTTTRDLMVGTVHVPAGTYTLYSVPNQNGQWQLVISRNTGQWGTEYAQEHDLGRTPMTVTTLSQPVEQFTIVLEGQGQNGHLRLRWDTTEASVPVIVH